MTLKNIFQLTTQCVLVKYEFSRDILLLNAYFLSSRIIARASLVLSLMAL
jgi:hypothetical protein